MSQMNNSIGLEASPKLALEIFETLQPRSGSKFHNGPSELCAAINNDVVELVIIRPSNIELEDFREITLTCEQRYIPFILIPSTVSLDSLEKRWAGTSSLSVTAITTTEFRFSELKGRIQRLKDQYETPTAMP